MSPSVVTPSKYVKPRTSLLFLKHSLSDVDGDGSGLGSAEVVPAVGTIEAILFCLVEFVVFTLSTAFFYSPNIIKKHYKENRQCGLTLLIYLFCSHCLCCFGNGIVDWRWRTATV
jgi:hypothetical protein